MRPWLILLVALVAATPVFAWHQAGHYATARIAWKKLGDKERAYYVNLLKKHPHHDTFLAAGRPADVPEIEWIFVRAAYWPDWVREPRHPSLSAAQAAAIKKEFNKPVWHYVNLPTIAPGEEQKFDAAAIRTRILEPEFDSDKQPRHVLAALLRCQTKLRSADTPDAEKAVYVCWLMHLVGDIHQPLHGTSLIASARTFDPKFDPPSGDLGGNRLAVKARAGGKTLRLHAYWDALLFADEPGFAGVDRVVAALLADPRLKPDQFPELAAAEFLTWAEESQKLAARHAYRDGDALLKAKALPPQFVEISDEDAPVLSDAYQKTAQEVARRRMTLAGYRLAKQLTAAME